MRSLITSGRPNQDRPGQTFLMDRLGCAQDPLVLALGVDHPLHLGLGLGEYRLHHQAGAEDKAAAQSRSYEKTIGQWRSCSSLSRRRGRMH